MADYTHRHHRRTTSSSFSSKLTSSLLRTFSSKTKPVIYDDVFSSRASDKPSSAPDDYSEIFNSSFTSSIPVLDLPYENNDVVSPQLRALQSVDYASIFGGVDNSATSCNVGLEPNLSEKRKSKNLSKEIGKTVVKENKTTQSTVEMPSRPEGMNVSDSAAEKPVNSMDGETHDTSDGNKQFDMSFIKSTVRSNKGMAEKVHVAKVQEVNEFECVIPRTTTPPKKNENTLPVPSTNDVNLPLGKTTKEKEEKHLRTVKSGLSENGVNGHSSKIDSKFQSLKGWDGSFSSDLQLKANEVSLKAHSSKVKPPSQLEHTFSYGKATSERIMRSKSRTSTNETSESVTSDCTPTFSDEEVDQNSAAAASAAAVRKAIEEAQARIIFAKELMQRQMEAPQFFVKQGTKNGFNFRKRKGAKMEYGANRTAVEKLQAAEKRENAAAQSIGRTETQPVTAPEQVASSFKGREEDSIPKQAAVEANKNDEALGWKNMEQASRTVVEPLMVNNMKETVVDTYVKQSAGKTNEKQASRDTTVNGVAAETKVPTNVEEAAIVTDAEETVIETNVKEAAIETNVKEVAVRTVRMWANYAYQALTKASVKEAAAEAVVKEKTIDRNTEEAAVERSMKEIATDREVTEAGTGSVEKEAVIGFMVKGALAGSSVKESIEEAYMEEAAVEVNATKPMVENGEEVTTADTMIKGDAVEPIAKEATTDPISKEVAVESTVEDVPEIVIQEAVAGPTLREAMVKCHEKKAGMNATVIESATETIVEETAMGISLEEVVAKSSLKESAEEIREEAPSITVVKKSAEEKSVQEAAQKMYLKENTEEVSVEEIVAGTSLGEAMNDTIVKESSEETSQEEVLESFVRKSEKEQSVGEATIATNVKECAEEISLEEAITNNILKELSEKIILEEDPLEAFVEKSGEEQGVGEAVIDANVIESAELACSEEAIDNANLNELSEKTSLEEDPSQTFVEKSAEEQSIGEAAISTNVKESAEETSVKEHGIKTIVNELTEESSLEEDATKANMEGSAEERSVEESGVEANVKDFAEESCEKEDATERNVKDFSVETSKKEMLFDHEDEGEREMGTPIENDELLDSYKHEEPALRMEQENSKMKASINKHERKRWQIPSETFELPKLDATDEIVHEENIGEDDSKKMVQSGGKHVRKKWDIPNRTLEPVELDLNNLKSVVQTFEQEKFEMKLVDEVLETGEGHLDHENTAAEIHELIRIEKTARDTKIQDMGQHKRHEQEDINGTGVQGSWSKSDIGEGREVLEGEGSKKGATKLDQRSPNESDIEDHNAEVNESMKGKFSFIRTQVDSGLGEGEERDVIREKTKIYASSYATANQDQGETSTYCNPEDNKRESESVGLANEGKGETYRVIWWEEEEFDKSQSETDLEDEFGTLPSDDAGTNYAEETGSELRTSDMENEMEEKDTFRTVYISKDGLECNQTESYSEDELGIPKDEVRVTDDMEEPEIVLDEVDNNSSPSTVHEEKLNSQEADQDQSTSQTSKQSEEAQIHSGSFTMEGTENQSKKKVSCEEHLKNIDQMKEKERAREDRKAVERAICEVRERAFAEARERAAMEKEKAEAKERLDKNSELKSSVEKASAEAKRRAERAAVDRATAEARERALEKSLSKMDSEHQGSDPSTSSSRHSLSSNRSKASFEKSDDKPTSESALRTKARLEKHQRIAERAAKALEEKNNRDLLAQKEQAERNRLAETLDADIKRWSSGKTGNLRALLSTLQYILGPNSGWQPISLTEIITTSAVKKAYRKATLFVHPDKLQQRGASIRQKYICEKVFDLLKDAWNRFNSEER